MSSPFVAEIRIFPFFFAPTGWAFCDGQILPLSQNTALFSLLGTFYGGDGKSNFALPNMQGSSPIQQGQAQTGTLYDLGEQSGVDAVTLIQTEIPVHTHAINCLDSGRTQGQVGDPTNGILTKAGGTTPPSAYINTPANTQLNFQAVSVVGGGLPHNNMMPYLTLNFCIALQGVFPPRG
ncbi:MAG TPA: tail fiber protein [Terracidiphilus sp.]|jgi:microcystin-dependent protein